MAKNVEKIANNDLFVDNVEKIAAKDSFLEIIT